MECLPSTHRTEGLSAFSARCVQPIQQQGRRLPSSSSWQVLRTRRFLVSICLAFSTQHMNSLRARGVISSQRVRTLESAANAVRTSAGNLCTVPLEICFAAIRYILHFLDKISSGKASAVCCAGTLCYRIALGREATGESAYRTHCIVPSISGFV